MYPKSMGGQVVTRCQTRLPNGIWQMSQVFEPRGRDRGMLQEVQHNFLHNVDPFSPFHEQLLPGCDNIIFICPAAVVGLSTDHLELAERQTLASIQLFAVRARRFPNKYSWQGNTLFIKVIVPRITNSYRQTWPVRLNTRPPMPAGDLQYVLSVMRYRQPPASACPACPYERQLGHDADNLVQGNLDSMLSD